MNWKLDNLTPEQEFAIRHNSRVAIFCSVLMPRLLEAESPKTELPAPPPDAASKSLNTYVPLAHR